MSRKRFTAEQIISKLREAEDLVRRKEFKDLGLTETGDAKQLIKLMAANPKIIERPIVVSGKRAAIGRPPAKVLEIL